MSTPKPDPLVADAEWALAAARKVLSADTAPGFVVDVGTLAVGLLLSRQLARLTREVEDLSTTIRRRL